MSLLMLGFGMICFILGLALLEHTEIGSIILLDSMIVLILFMVEINMPGSISIEFLCGSVIAIPCILISLQCYLIFLKG